MVFNRVIRRSGNQYRGLDDIPEITRKQNYQKILKKTSSGIDAWYSKVKSLTNSMTNIGDYIFSGCTNLKSVVFGNKIQEVNLNIIAVR